MVRSDSGLPRVALVTHSLTEGGGTATMTAFLYRVLSDSGRYHPEIVSLALSSSDTASVRLRAPQSWRQGPQIQSNEWHGLPFYHVGANLAEIEFQRYKPRQVLEQLLNKYDLIQFISGTPPWACAADGVQRPLVLWTATMVWGDRFSRLQGMPFLRRMYFRFMTHFAQMDEKRALQTVSHVFALSKYTQDAIRGQMPSARSELAACGVDTAHFRPDRTHKSDYIVSVARFSDPRKNVRLLLDAYTQLAQCNSNLPDLYLVGELPEQSLLEKLKASNLAERVHCLGLKQGQELAELYRHAHFFVLASDEEGLGIVILEAMASGLAVVSTRCGGPETVVIDGQTGFLTPVGDAGAFSEAMGRLINDPDLCDRMGQAGRQLAEDRFSLATAGKVFLDKYDELLGKQR